MVAFLSLGLGKLHARLFKEPRDGLALLRVGADGELRLEALDVLACDKCLHLRTFFGQPALVFYHMLADRAPFGTLRKENSAQRDHYRDMMERKAIEILAQYRLMTIATLRADGWPQATMVNYANEGLLLYFIISKQSQKYANIQRDSRVSIVVGRDFADPREIKALSIAANASDVRDPVQREQAIDLVLARHPALAALGRPNLTHSAVIRAYCSIVTILDYSQGFGHADVLTVSGDIAEMAPRRDDDWGFLKVSDGPGLSTST